MIYKEMIKYRSTNEVQMILSDNVQHFVVER